eukprot:158645-Chlamydomonas_euryale.AAC.1
MLETPSGRGRKTVKTMPAAPPVPSAALLPPPALLARALLPPSVLPVGSLDMTDTRSLAPCSRSTADGQSAGAAAAVPPLLSSPPADGSDVDADVAVPSWRSASLRQGSTCARWRSASSTPMPGHTSRGSTPPRPSLNLTRTAPCVDNITD